MLHILTIPATHKKTKIIGFVQHGQKIDVNECELENLCDYGCHNTVGSYTCVEQISYDGDDNDSNQNANNANNADNVLELKEVKYPDREFDIIERESEVSICLNGFYFNETIGDCQGKIFYTLFEKFYTINQ